MPAGFYRQKSSVALRFLVVLFFIDDARIIFVDEAQAVVVIVVTVVPVESFLNLGGDKCGKIIESVADVGLS